VTFQQRVKACMRRRDMRVADVARWFDRSYTTVREWVLFGRQPGGPQRERDKMERRLRALERS
jgi:hypothetical protein